MSSYNHVVQCGVVMKHNSRKDGSRSGVEDIIWDNLLELEPGVTLFGYLC